MAEYARLLGFGCTQGIDLPGEISGLMPDKEWKKQVKSESWYPGDTVISSIGQGFILTTPLQVANAYAALANGGYLYTPRLLKKVNDYNAQPLLENNEGAAVRKVEMTSGELRVLLDGFSSVVNENGTGRQAALEHVEVCGKTGTAQVDGKNSHAWFVCFAPRENPTAVVVVLVENGGHGGEVAAPIAKEILLRIFPAPEEEKVS